MMQLKRYLRTAWTWTSGQVLLLMARLTFPIRPPPPPLSGSPVSPEDIPHYVMLHKGWLAFAGLETDVQDTGHGLRHLRYLKVLTPNIVMILHFGVNLWSVTGHRDDDHTYSPVVCFVGDVSPADMTPSAVHIVQSGFMLIAATLVSMNLMNRSKFCGGWIRVWPTLLGSRQMDAIYLSRDDVSTMFRFICTPLLPHCSIAVSVRESRST